MANNPMPPANLMVLAVVVLAVVVLEAVVLADREVWGPAEEKEANLARAVVKECPVAPVGVNLVEGRAVAPAEANWAVVNSDPRS
jgi:hypothetical protein